MACPKNLQVLSGHGMEAKLWDFKTGKSLFTQTGRDQISSAALSNEHDGVEVPESLKANLHFLPLQLKDQYSGLALEKYCRSSHEISALTFSQDNQFILTGS